MSSIRGSAYISRMDYDDEEFGYSADEDEGVLTRNDDDYVLDCGIEGCLMPGYHLRSECHTVADAHAYEDEMIALDARPTQSDAKEDA